MRLSLGFREPLPLPGLLLYCPSLVLPGTHQCQLEPPGHSHLVPPYQLVLVSGEHGQQRPLSTQHPELGPSTDPGMDLLGGLWRKPPSAS